MAKKIKVTAKANNISANSYNNEITTAINTTGVITSIIDQDILANTEVLPLELDVILTGLGEESILQPELFKYLQHLVSNIDVARKNFGKGLIDTIARSEVFSQHIKPFKIDTATTIDAFSRVVYFRRTFEELVDATDDFYGVTNIDDDQTAFVEKRINESFTRIEDFRKSFGKRFNESFTSSEIVSKVSSLLKLDTANTGEEYKVTMALIKSDNASIADQVSKVFSRGLTVDLVLTNDLSSKATSTVYRDVLGLSDFITDIFFNKRVLEVVGYSERTLFEVFRISSDIANISDSVAKAFSRPVASDSTTITDTLFKKHIFVSIVEFSGAYFSELYTELQYSSEFGYTTNPVYLTDVITSFNFSKVILDSVDATDDFYGLANVDDDQTARIDKVVIDYGTLTELFSRITTFIRSFTDVASVSEEFRNSISKIFSDQINRSDIVTKLYAKVSTETVSSSQTLSINIQSYFQQDYVEAGYAGQNYTY